jgi:hypothetical protein
MHLRAGVVALVICATAIATSGIASADATDDICAQYPQGDQSGWNW